MSEDRGIVMRNWERFQHYNPELRDPPWIKVYTRLMSDENYMSLTPHRCAMLHRLWLEYARSGRELAENTLSLSRRLGMKVTRRDLEALNHAGFLEFTLAKRYQDASPRARDAGLEELKEQEKELGLTQDKDRKSERPEKNEEQELSEEEPLEDRSADLAELMQGLADGMGDPWKDWK